MPEEKDNALPKSGLPAAPTERPTPNGEIEEHLQQHLDLALKYIQQDGTGLWIETDETDWLMQRFEIFLNAKLNEGNLYYSDIAVARGRTNESREVWLVHRDSLKSLPYHQAESGPGQRLTKIEHLRSSLDVEVETTWNKDNNDGREPIDEG